MQSAYCCSETLVGFAVCCLWKNACCNMHAQLSWDAFLIVIDQSADILSIGHVTFPLYCPLPEFYTKLAVKMCVPLSLSCPVDMKRSFPHCEFACNLIVLIHSVTGSPAFMLLVSYFLF